MFSETGKAIEDGQPPRTFIPNKDNGKPYMNHMSTNLSTIGISEDGLQGPPRPLQDLALSDYRLAELASGMQRIIEHLDGVQESDANQEDWKFAAEVLDSFFFWLLTITFLVSTTIFYSMVP